MNKIAFIDGITPVYKAGFLTSALYVFFFTLLFVSRLNQSFITIGSIGLLLGGIITHIHLYVKLYNNRLYKSFWHYYIFIILLICANFILIHNFEFKALLHGIIILPALALLIYFFDYKTWVCLLPFSCVSLLVIYKWFILGLGPEEVTVNSRNYIVFFLFLYVMPYSLHCYRQNKLPSLFLPLFILVIAILAIGRASIIMAVLFLVGWLFMLLKQTRYKVLVWIIIISIVSCTIHFGFVSDNFEVLFSRFEEKGFESSSRTDAWIQYLQYTFSSLYNILFGTKTISVPLVKSLNGSLHNSLLTSHAYMGIFFIYYIYLAMKGYLYFLKKRNFFMLAFFGSLLIKAFVDADFPCTAVGGDIYMCILILIGLNYRDSKYKIVSK